MQQARDQRRPWPRANIAPEPGRNRGGCHMRLLSNLLRRFIRHGTLRVRAPDGAVHVFGGRLPGPDVAIHLHDRKLYSKLFVNPELYAAEAYMDETLTLENGATI